MKKFHTVFQPTQRKALEANFGLVSPKATFDARRAREEKKEKTAQARRTKRRKASEQTGHKRRNSRGSPAEKLPTGTAPFAAARESDATRWEQQRKDNEKRDMTRGSE